MKRATKNTLSKGHIFSSLTPQIWEKMEKFQIFNFKLTLTWQIFDGLQKIITHKSCSFGRQTTFVQLQKKNFTHRKKSYQGKTLKFDV